MISIYLKVRERDLLEEAERERLARLLRRTRTPRLVEFARAMTRRLSRVRRLIDDMAAADAGNPAPRLRDYPLASAVRRPRRATGDC